MQRGSRVGIGRFLAGGYGTSGRGAGGRPASRQAAGFTLMEMLVVLVIIGLISAVAIPQVMKLMESAKAKAARIQLETVGQSLNHFSIDIGRYPTTQEGLAALLNMPDDDPAWDGPYVRGPEQLKDPWGRALLYEAPSTAGTGKFTLRSLGADGAEGGSGDDLDLDYRN